MVFLLGKLRKSWYFTVHLYYAKLYTETVGLGNEVIQAAEVLDYSLNTQFRVSS